MGPSVSRQLTQNLRYLPKTSARHFPSPPVNWWRARGITVGFTSEDTTLTGGSWLYGPKGSRPRHTCDFPQPGPSNRRVWVEHQMPRRAAPFLICAATQPALSMFRCAALMWIRELRPSTSFLITQVDLLRSVLNVAGFNRECLDYLEHSAINPPLTLPRYEIRNSNVGDSAAFVDASFGILPSVAKPSSLTPNPWTNEPALWAEGQRQGSESRPRSRGAKVQNAEPKSLEPRLRGQGTKLTEVATPKPRLTKSSYYK